LSRQHDKQEQPNRPEHYLARHQDIVDDEEPSIIHTIEVNPAQLLIALFCIFCP
jgi:hypothetical protein